MKLHRSRQRNRALTLVEVLFVVAVLIILGAMLLPALAAAKKNSRGPWCTNNLKQLALAMSVWAGDNNGKFPMQVSTNNGGAMELMNTPDAWKVFQVMSNELGTPKVLHCPKDSAHVIYATNFGDALKSHISYFISVDATAANPQSILSGDDSFLLNQSPAHPGLISLTSPAQLKWDSDRHGGATQRGWFNKTKTPGTGNIVLADGNVESITDSGLTNYLGQTGLATNRFVIP